MRIKVVDRSSIGAPGEGWRERERIKRKAERWARRWVALPLEERGAIMAQMIRLINESERGVVMGSLLHFMKEAGAQLQTRTPRLKKQNKATLHLPRRSASTRTARTPAPSTPAT